MMLPSTDTTYPTFWRQATRWLAASSPDPVVVRTRSVGSNQIEISVDARDDSFRPARDADIQLDIRGADGSVQTMKAVPVDSAHAAYRAEARVPAGITRIDARATSRGVTLGRPTVWALAGPDNRELVEPRRNDEQLSRLAASFAGRLVAPDDVPGVVEEVSARASSTGPLLEQDVWHSAWVLLAVLSLLGAEWTLRRKWGLR
jgi:hypothetical protein